MTGISDGPVAEFFGNQILILDLEELFKGGARGGYGMTSLQLYTAESTPRTGVGRDEQSDSVQH